jgi:hypothetical protein
MSESDKNAEALGSSLSEAFGVHPVSPGRLVIQTPFGFGDGDGYPVVIEKVESGWRLTDMGGTASHLAMEDIDFTQARLELLVDIAESSGFEFDELVLNRIQPDLPSIFDIADLLQAIAQLGAIRHLSKERVRRLYRDDISKFIEGRVPPENRVLRWRPSTDTKGVYAADALLRPADPSGRPTTLFAVGNAEQAERATIAILMHTRWDLDVAPLVILDRRVMERIGSPRIYHLQDAAGDESVFPAAPGEWAPVERHLKARHIPLLAA